MARRKSAAGSSRHGHVLRLGAALFAAREDSEPAAFLPIGQPVLLIEALDDWTFVEVADGTRGYIRPEDISWRPGANSR